MGRWAQQQRRGSIQRGAGSPPCTIAWDADPLYQGGTRVEVFYTSDVILAHFDPASFSVVIAGVRIFATSKSQSSSDSIDFFATGFSLIVGGELAEQLYGPPEFCAPESGMVQT